MVATRGTSNSNVRGSSTTRAARKTWLLETYAADVRVLFDPVGINEDEGEEALAAEVVVSDGFVGQDVVWLLLPTTALGAPAARCYRCGCLLTYDTLTIDRIVPGCRGGSYARNNIRPACGTCNSSTGGRTRSQNKTKARRK